MDDKGIMNGHADEQQGLHIPEHLLQEAHTTSHVTGTTPRSAGLFDYISRAANSAATILQTTPFSTRSKRTKAVNGAIEQVITPTVRAIEGSKPPDIQDRSNSKYPQVVQPQNSVEACVFDDGGADSMLEGVSVELGRNRSAPRAAKAVTFQDGDDSVLGRPSGQRRNAMDEGGPQEISFNPPPAPAADPLERTQQGQFEFNAVATTAAPNPYSKLVELCKNRKGRRTGRGAAGASAGNSSWLPAPSSALPGAPLAIAGPSTSHRTHSTANNEITRATTGNKNTLIGDSALVRFEPSLDPVAVATAMPPSATTTYHQAGPSGTGAGTLQLAPQLSMHFGGPAISSALQPSGGVPSAALPVSKRLSHAPPMASRYALFGPAAVKPSVAVPPASATAAANALIAAPSNPYPNPRLQASAAAAGWRMPKKDMGAPSDRTSTWVPSRARMLARRRAARIRFKPGATAADPFTNSAASQELVLRSGAKRNRDLSPGDVVTMHERSATRRRIDSSVSVARRSLRAADQPQITAGEVLAAADAIAQRKVAAQHQVPALDLSRALLSSQQIQNPMAMLPGVFGAPGGACISDLQATNGISQQPGRLGSTIRFTDALQSPLTPSTALIAEEARREKARRARERDTGPSSVSPPTKRHAPGGSPLDPPSLAGPSFPNATPEMVGRSTTSGGMSGATDPPTNLDSSLLFPSAQPVSALVGGAVQAHAGHSGPAPSNGVGPVLDLLEKKRQEMARGDCPAMTISEVRQKLNAQEEAKKAAEEQRKQAARGAPPDNPLFQAPASDSQQAQPWPAWDRAVKEREAAGLPKFSNISQVMKALPDRGADDGPSCPAEPYCTSAAPGGSTPPVAGSRPPVPPLFGPGSVSAAKAAAGGSGVASYSATASAAVASGGVDGAPLASSKPGAGETAGVGTEASNATTEAPAKKKKPVVSGWGDAFLKSNAAESAAAQKAIQEEVDKANNPSAAVSFGSPVPSAIAKGSVSFGGPPPTFGTQDPPTSQLSAPPVQSGDASAPAASSASFSFGTQPSQPTTSGATDTAPLFGQEPASTTTTPLATSGKRRARDDDDEPAAKRSMPFSSGLDGGAAPSFGVSTAAAAPAASSAPSTNPLFPGLSAAAGSTVSAPLGGSFLPGLFGQSTDAAASKALFGAPAAAPAAASAPLFGAPAVSTGTSSAAVSTAMSASTGMPSFTFGGSSAAATGTAASGVAAAPGGAMPLFGAGSTGAASTGAAQTPLFGSVHGGSLFGANSAATPTNPASAVQSAPSFGGGTFGSSGFGGASGFGAPSAGTGAATTTTPTMPSFGAAAPAGAGAPVTTGSLFGTAPQAASGGISGFGATGTAAVGGATGTAALLSGGSTTSATTPNGFAPAGSAPGPSLIVFGAASSAGMQPLGGGASTLFGASSGPTFSAAAPAVNNAPGSASLFGGNSNANTMFGGAPAAGIASASSLFGASASSAALGIAAASSGGFTFSGGFGAPASGAASQGGAGAAPTSLFGAAPTASGGSTNPFGNPSGGAPFGSNNAGGVQGAAPFQFGGASVAPTPSPTMGGPGNNSIFGNNNNGAASGAAAGGFGGPGAALPFGASGSGAGFGAPNASGSGFGGTGFGAAPGQVGSPAFGAQPAPFGGGAPSPIFPGAQQPQVPGVPQQPAAQMGAMFGAGNNAAFNMGSSQPNQGRKGRVTVRRRAGGRSGR